MLEDTCDPATEFIFDFLPVAILAFDDDGKRSFYVPNNTWDLKTALYTHQFLVGHTCDFWIDDCI